MFVGLLTLATLAAAGTVFTAVQQPWIGVILTAGDDGTIVISRVQRDDFEPGLSVGERLNAVGTYDTDGLQVNANDIVEEPEALNSYSALNIFRERQSVLAAMQGQDVLWLDVTNASGERRRVYVEPQTHRPIWSLPFEFWLQLFVGYAGVVLGAWVWALRRREAGPFYLAISGVGLLAAAISAAIYGTRELALPADLLVSLAYINQAGTISWGSAIICLLSVYPRRIASDRVLAAIWVLTAFAPWISIGQLAPSPGIGSYAIIVLQLITIGVLVGVQLVLTRGDLVARAALGWFGLSVLAGSIVFVFAIAAPLMFGLEPQISQAHAFGIVLLFYAGLALGVARYRLFDLGSWAFRLGSYLIGAILLVALDALLIYGVAVERVPAFGIALLVVGLMYLPLRNAIGARLDGRAGATSQSFPQLVEIALERVPDKQAADWEALLMNTFAPLTIDPAASVTKVEIADDGQGLLVPGHRNLPSIKMQYANGGRRLFSNRDVDRAQNLIDLVTHAINSSDAHEQGVRNERSRIARDLHDNIGAQLLRTLHTTDLQRKDAIVSETLTDLRDIISNAQGSGMALDEVLAELRFETNERLALAGLRLNWRYAGAAETGISARLAHTLRSVVRECASNTIRHAQADQLSIDITQTETEIELEVSDDGKGFDSDEPKPGRGLNNISSRVLGEGGSLSIEGSQGMRVQARFPLAPGEVA